MNMESKTLKHVQTNERFTVIFEDGVKFEATLARIRPHTQLAVGSRIEARYHDAMWYPATITDLPVSSTMPRTSRSRVTTKCFRRSCGSATKNDHLKSSSSVDDDDADLQEYTSNSAAEGRNIHKTAGHDQQDNDYTKVILRPEVIVKKDQQATDIHREIIRQSENIDDGHQCQQSPEHSQQDNIVRTAPETQRHRSAQLQNELYNLINEHTMHKNECIQNIHMSDDQSEYLFRDESCAEKSCIHREYEQEVQSKTKLKETHPKSNPYEVIVHQYHQRTDLHHKNQKSSEILKKNHEQTEPLQEINYYTEPLTQEGKLTDHSQDEIEHLDLDLNDNQIGTLQLTHNRCATYVQQTQEQPDQLRKRRKCDLIVEEHKYTEFLIKEQQKQVIRLSHHEHVCSAPIVTQQWAERSEPLHSGTQGQRQIPQDNQSGLAHIARLNVGCIKQSNSLPTPLFRIQPIVSATSSTPKCDEICIQSNKIEDPFQHIHPQAEFLEGENAITNSEERVACGIDLHKNIYKYMTFLETIRSPDFDNSHNESSYQNEVVGDPSVNVEFTNPESGVTRSSMANQETRHFDVPQSAMKNTQSSNEVTSTHSLIKDSLRNNSSLSNISVDEIPSPVVESTQHSISAVEFQAEFSINGPISVANVPKGKYVWRKKNYCKFCSKPLNKVSRHIESSHPLQEEVIRLRGLPLKSVERRKLQEKIRREGNFLHNQQVLGNKEGTIMPQVRNTSSGKASANDYLPCLHCKGFFKKEFISVHNKRCLLNESRNARKKIAVEAKMMLLNIDGTSESFKENIIADMTSDAITDAVIGDELIMKMGEKLHYKLKKRKNHNYIRQRMRETARLLMTVQSIDDDIECFEDLFHPQNFDSLTKAVKTLAKYDERTGKFEKGALPVKLGHHLNLCATILRSRAIRTSDDDLKRRIRDFLDLMKTDYAAINALAHATLKERRFNKPKYLPLAKDVKKLSGYITEQMAVHTEELIRTGDSQAYTRVAQLTLASVLLFNRRRSGEMQEITVDNFKKGCLVDHSSDISDRLGTVETLLLNKLKRIEIMGKKGRGVCVLLRPAHLSAINLLLAHREAVGISKDEPLVFARPTKNSKTPMNACSVLRLFTTEANLEKPELIRSTKLRKHIATFSQLVDLSSVELQQLANFMGHDLNVHMDYYRLPDDITQITKVGRLLVAAEDGMFNRGRAMTLSDIHIEEETVTGVPSAKTSDPDDIMSSANTSSANAPCEGDEEQLQNKTNENDIADSEDEFVVMDSDADESNDSDHFIKENFTDKNLRVENGGCRTKFSLNKIREIEETRGKNSKLTTASMSKKKHVRKWNPWRFEDKEKVKEYFKKFFDGTALPGKCECEEFLRVNKKMKRNWTNIKDLVRNERKKQEMAKSKPTGDMNTQE